jgi:hypothetical protein
MKCAAVTLLFTTFTLASQAPTAQLGAAAAPTLVTQPDVKPIDVKTYDNPATTLEMRVAKSEVISATGLRLGARNPKNKVKINNSTIADTGAAGILLPNCVLLGGMIGLGVVEIARVWS